MNAVTAELKAEKTAASLYWSKEFLIGVSFEERVQITNYFQISLRHLCYQVFSLFEESIS